MTEIPKLGFERNERQEAIYTYPQGSHFIDYRESSDGIEVAQVLHQSMDYVDLLTS